MTWFDAMVIGVIALSTVFAALRGATREAATLIAIVAAMFAAVWGAATFGKSLSIVTAVAMAAGLFFAVFLPGILLLGAVMKQPATKRNRRIDRLCGGVFGAARGVVLVGLGYLAYSYVLAADRQPPAVRDAATLPVARSVAEAFETLVPASARLEEKTYGEPPADEPAKPAKSGGGKNSGAQQSGGEASSAPDRAALGYTRSERDGLEEMIVTLTTTDATPAHDQTVAANAVAKPQKKDPSQ